jgi:hypothetical protein
MLILTEVLSPVFIIVDGFLQGFKCMFLANVSVLASSTQFGKIGGAYPEFAIIIAIGLRGQESQNYASVVIWLESTKIR